MFPHYFGQNKFCITIVTKYFSAKNSVDAVSVHRLIKLMLDRDPYAKICVVTSDGGYGKGKTENIKNVLESKSVYVLKIPFPRFTIKNDYFKVIIGLIEGFALVFATRFIRTSNVLTLSNPPLINVWCGFLLRGMRWFYWSFDLYPDALFATNIDNIFRRVAGFIDKTAYKRAPYAIAFLGVNQYKYLLNKYSSHNIKGYYLPCGLHNESTSLIPPKWFKPSMIILGYVGNIGRAHSADFLINVIKAKRARNKILLVIAIYGFHARKILDEVAALEDDNILVVDHLNQSELGWIDVHLVSLEPNWTNISVPSKAVSAVCSGGALWFCGSKKADTFLAFQSCSYYSNPDFSDVNNVMVGITVDSVAILKSNSIGIKAEMLKGEMDSVQSILKT